MHLVLELPQAELPVFFDVAGIMVICESGVGVDLFAVRAVPQGDASTGYSRDFKLAPLWVGCGPH